MPNRITERTSPARVAFYFLIEVRRGVTQQTMIAAIMQATKKLFQIADSDYIFTIQPIGFCKSCPVYNILRPVLK